MKMKLKLATLANVLGFFVVFGFAAAMLTSAAALRELKVGGPVYERVVLGKDLVALRRPLRDLLEAVVLELQHDLHLSKGQWRQRQAR